MRAEADILTSIEKLRGEIKRFEKINAKFNTFKPPARAGRGVRSVVNWLGNLLGLWEAVDPTCREATAELFGTCCCNSGRGRFLRRRQGRPASVRECVFHRCTGNLQRFLLLGSLHLAHKSSVAFYRLCENAAEWLERCPPDKNTPPHECGVGGNERSCWVI